MSDHDHDGRISRLGFCSVCEAAKVAASVGEKVPQLVEAPVTHQADLFQSLDGQVGRVFDMMRDGRWYTLRQLSGALGIGPDGKLGDGMAAQAKLAMDNLGAGLKAAGLGWGDVVKCTVMLDDMKDWPAFNQVYVTYFPDKKFPARSAFGADGLALGALLEVECMAYAGPK